MTSEGMAAAYMAQATEIFVEAEGARQRGVWNLVVRRSQEIVERALKAALRAIGVDHHLTFLTNNLLLPALTIAQLDQCRWQIELFFKWIKQHLRIQRFYGTSSNAVKTQVWTALCVYLLVAIVQKQLKTELSLYTILQILSLTLFEKTPISQVLTHPSQHNEQYEPCNQLNLFNF